MQKSNRRIWLLPILFIFMLTLFFLAIKYNFYTFNNGDIFNFIFKSVSNESIKIRIIKLVAMIFAVSALGISGLLMQTITRNPLASPGIMGMVSSSKFATALFMVVIPVSSLISRYFIILFFATIPLLLITFISKKRINILPTTLALTGITIGLIFSSFEWLILYWTNAEEEYVMSFLNSSFNGITITHIKYFVPPIAIGFILSISLYKSFDIYKMGDSIAKSLGAKIKLTRIIAYAIVIFLVPASLILGGNILFIGVIIPHLSRFLMKTHKTFLLIITTTLMASILVLITAILDSYIGFNVSNILSMFCAPFFIYLASRSKSG